MIFQEIEFFPGKPDVEPAESSCWSTTIAIAPEFPPEPLFPSFDDSIFGEDPPPHICESPEDPSHTDDKLFRCISQWSIDALVESMTGDVMSSESMRALAAEMRDYAQLDARLCLHPLIMAASFLDHSPTYLELSMRQLGIPRWPYHRLMMIRNIAQHRPVPKPVLTALVNDALFHNNPDIRHAVDSLVKTI